MNAERKVEAASPTLIALETSVREAIVDDATGIIQRVPFLCRYPARLFDAGLVSELADASDKLAVKVAQLQEAQGEDR